MPLEILLVLVVGGVAAIGLTLHVLGFSRARPFDADTAERQWRRHFPEAGPVTVLLAQSGRAALVEDAQGRGVLWQFGADTVARRLPCRKVEDHTEGLRFFFADFTAPVVLLKLTPEERRTWKEELASA